MDLLLYLTRRPDPQPPTDAARLRHVLKAIDCLAEIGTPYPKTELLTKELPLSGGCRCFSLIAEAVAGISPELRRQHPQMDWRRWKRYGRRLRYEYHRLNYQRLWQPWQPATLPLRQQVLTILMQQKQEVAHV